MPTYYKPWNAATEFSYEELADAMVERLDENGQSLDLDTHGDHTMNKEPWKSNRTVTHEE